MRRLKTTIFACIFSCLCYAGVHAAEEIIDISVKGISDNKKDGAQKDRMEAIMDAKRQACEKAGLTISSKTTVQNFQTVFDYVESRASAVLLPGFQVIDIGYMDDGTYSVVLVGKIKKTGAVSGDRAAFTILVWLRDENKNITDKTDLIDRLYDWLNGFKGEFKILDKGLDGYEADCASIMRYDSLFYNERRYYAFTYTVPADGDLIYTQRTPTTDGKVSAYDFKIKLRPGKQYIMSIAHAYAFYFHEPEVFDGTYKHLRDNFAFPANFKKIFPIK